MINFLVVCRSNIVFGWKVLGQPTLFLLHLLPTLLFFFSLAAISNLETPFVIVYKFYLGCLIRVFFLVQSLGFTERH